MRVLKPLIEKNLIHVKRNILKTLLQLFYPCIIMIFMISFLSSKENVLHLQEMSFSAFAYNISLSDDSYPFLTL